ncbi:MAG TPA: AMP-binding protein [Pseudonocardiaceae bacterium]|jgi:acetyl-CoA synthetase|nr:AMP-binding protein [Pseudonocardiaceae bacterium]
MSLPAKDSSAAPTGRIQELSRIYGDPELSVADVLCDRHPVDAIAYTIVESDLRVTALTYGELSEASARFAAALAELGVGAGDRVAVLMSKCAEQLIAVMGIWRLGAVHVPLFTAFAPSAIALRVLGSGAKVVICDSAQRTKLRPGEDLPVDPPWRVVVVGDELDEGDLNMRDLLARHESGLPAAAVGGSGPIIQIYTSGTTGRPKGVVVPAAALTSFHTYMEFGLDLRPEDTFWNAADPGWAYGLYYGIIGSMCVGAPSVWLHHGFDAELTWQVMSGLRVTNFAAAPTVYRSLRASNTTAPGRLFLRAASAAGEPLTPEVNEWAADALGVAVHDHYGQTETGMVINNHHHPALARPLRAGTMGHPMPGWRAVVLREHEDLPAPPGALGRIAFDLRNSPLAWFTGYHEQPGKSAEKFSPDGRWYYTGDTALVDQEGYWHFMSRDDDVIIMAGYRIGPYDVESVLLGHYAVIDAAVIAAPDELRGEVLEAYVVLRDGRTGTPELVEELQRLVKTRFAAHAYPRTVHFIDVLPKTASGKVQRHVLRQRRRRELQDVRR